MTRVLVIDSYDSFVYNLVQYVGELGAEPVVRRNDELTVAEALARLREADVPSAPVKSLEETLADPQVAHNRIIETHPHPVAGPVHITRPAARFSDTPTAITRHAPGHGEIGRAHV